MPRPRGHGPGFEARRQKIIDDCAVLFAERGYTATSIDDICAAVGLGRGALYRYIGSKGSLLFEIQNRVLEPLLARSLEIEDVDADPATRLAAVSLTLLTNMTDRLDHVWVYEHDYRLLTGSERRRMVLQRHQFEGVVERLIARAIEVGQFRPMDPRLAMLQFLNLHNYTYQWWRPSLGLSPEALSAEYCATVFAGFAADGWSWQPGDPPRSASLMNTTFAVSSRGGE